MSTTFYTESQPSTALMVSQAENFCDVNCTSRESADTVRDFVPMLESAQAESANSKLCEPNCVTSLAEQYSYYLARATAAEALWKANAGTDVQDSFYGSNSV